MLFGLPLELFSLAGGWLMGFISKRHEQSIELRKLELETMQVAHNIDQEVREGPVRGQKEFQWTRRTLAIGAFFSIMLAPRIALVFFDIPIVYTYDIETGGFLWIDPNTETAFSIAKAWYYLPYESHIMATVFGLYFGKGRA